MRLTRRHATLFQLAFAGALLGFLYRQGDLELGDLFLLFRGEGYTALLGAGTLILSSIFLGGYRLHLYFRSAGHPLGIGSFAKLNYVGFLMAQVLPGVTASDVVRGYFLAHHMKSDSMAGLAIMVWDRIIGLVTLLFMGLVPAMGLILHHYGIAKAWPLVLLSGALVMSLMWVARDPEKIARIVRTLEIWLPVPTRLRNRKSQGRALLKGLVSGFRLNLVGFGLSLAVHGLNMGALLVLARALGDTTPLMNQALLIPVVILAGVVPATPGNVGWNEYISQVSWSVLGASSIGAQVFASYRIVGILISLPALYWVVSSPMRAPAIDKNAPALMTPVSEGESAS